MFKILEHLTTKVRKIDGEHKEEKKTHRHKIRDSVFALFCPLAPFSSKLRLRGLYGGKKVRVSKNNEDENGAGNFR